MRLDEPGMETDVSVCVLSVQDCKQSGRADRSSALLPQQRRAEDRVSRRRRSGLQPGHRTEGRSRGGSEFTPSRFSPPPSF